MKQNNNEDKMDNKTSKSKIMTFFPDTHPMEEEGKKILLTQKSEDKKVPQEKPEERSEYFYS